MKKAVITGATGYIGSNLLNYLLPKGWDISIIAQPKFGYENIIDQRERIRVMEYDGDIHTLISFFKEQNPDVVFHLAASVISDYMPEQVDVLIQSNILFGTQVLEAMKYATTRLLINTGTYWQSYHSDTYNPVNLYAATKEAFEKIIQYYVDAHGFRIITLRLFDVYGENDKRPKLLNQLRRIAETGESLDVSPGEQYLDMVHILDVCSAYLRAYELLSTDNRIKNKIYGVYSGDRIRLKDMINQFQEVLAQPLNVNFGGKKYKKREIMMPTNNYEKLPNWKVEISLMDGLNLFNKRFS